MAGIEPPPPPSRRLAPAPLDKCAKGQNATGAPVIWAETRGGGVGEGTGGVTSSLSTFCPCPAPWLPTCGPAHPFPACLALLPRSRSAASALEEKLVCILLAPENQP